MFKIAEELMQKNESVLTVNEPALASGNGITYVATCGDMCYGNCSGSCKGSCTASCQRNSR